MILAIDDDPGRYDYLRVVLGERATVAGMAPFLSVATCRQCVTDALPDATAILLDFDLDGREECAKCTGWNDVANGAGFLDSIIARGVPVIVSSCSSPPNRKYLFDRLHAHGVRVAAIPADHLGVEREWLGCLWAWGVL